MDTAVIKKMLDTSSLNLLGAKASASLQRRALAQSAPPPAPPPGDVVPPPGDEPGDDPLETYEDETDTIDGPFDEPEEAVATDIEALHEVEDDIGMATWLDAATGEPAEGMCPPHLDAD